MALVKKDELLLVFLILTTLYGISIATFYRVGDSAGWTTTGNIDYTSWATSKNFLIGDTLLFEYDGKLHNVMQVQRHDYHSCNVNAPISLHTSGNDSFTIGNHGHFFFICGIPGHCEAGQRLDIRVVKVAPPQNTASPEVVMPNRVPQASALSLGAPSPSRLIALPPEAVSCAGAAAFSRLQIVLTLVFMLCFYGYVS